MEWPVPYWTRLGVLTLVLTAIAVGELLIRKEEATRWREYLFLAIAAALGAIYGVLVDQVTSRISPDYFLYAKGLDEDRFRLEVVELGAMAGIAGAVISACVLLVSDSAVRGRRRFRVQRALSMLRFPLMGSIIVAVLVGTGFFLFVPDSFAGPFQELLEDGRVPRFRAVIGAHYGLYLGGLIGTIMGVRQLRHFRKCEARLANGIE